MLRRILTAAALLICAASVTPAAAQRAHLGMHGGYNWDLEEEILPQLDDVTNAMRDLLQF
jgi:Spy/CpxP family protein refolding chaperone